VAAALAVVVAAGVTALVVRHRGAVPVTPATSPVTAWTANLPEPSEFPARIAPEPEAPALPATAVGRGVWIYPDATTDGLQYLVAADGRQYRLFGPICSLAPDGRWLVEFASVSQSATTTLRDLRGEATIAVPGRSAAWSPNGRWVATVIQGSSPLADATVRVVDLADPGAAPASFTVPVVATPLMVMDSGDVVLSVPSKTAGVFDLVVRQQLTGASGRPVTVDYRGALDPEDFPATTIGIAREDTVAVGGRTVAVSDDRLLLQAVSRRGAANVDGPVVSIDLATGTATRAFAVTGAAGEAWRLDRVLADGSFLLVHWRDGRAVSLDRYDPVARQRTRLTDLTAG
jgi:hypothetical protein